MRKRKKPDGAGLRLILSILPPLALVLLLVLPQLAPAAERDPVVQLIRLQLPAAEVVEAEDSRQVQYEAAADPPETDVDADVGSEVRIELLSVDLRDTVKLAEEGPAILVYHTHATEAYRQIDGEEYEESGDWRTRDNERNIVAVGETLCRLLRDEYGLNVLHDTTDHEPPKLSTAYSRSLVTMERVKREYPSVSVFIDVHRDAYGDAASGREDFVLLEGRETARLMFVVGTGEGATGAGFGEMPDFQSNYALAKRLTEYLNGIHSGLTRSIRVKTGRYNQHVSSQCILVEVGHNANTFTQAENAMLPLAAAIADAVGAKEGAMLRWTP